MGYRDGSGKFVEADDHIRQWCGVNGIKIIKIVLAVCHMDHIITNNVPENLLALCQKCHVNHDKQKHVMSRHINRALREKE